MQLLKNYSIIFLAIGLSLVSDNLLAVKAAGVLPFCHDKKHRTYFFFGREARGTAQGTFADFGGKFEKNDTKFRQAASREFAEESMSIFKTRKGKTLDEKTTLDVINKHSIPSAYLKFSNGQGGYATYFLRIQNDANIFTNFTNKRAHLNNQLAKKPSKQLYAQTEKDELVSVRKRDLFAAIKANNPWVKVTSSTNKNNNGKKVKLRDCTFKSLRNAYNNGILQNL